MASHGEEEVEEQERVEDQEQMEWEQVEQDQGEARMFEPRRAMR